MLAIRRVDTATSPVRLVWTASMLDGVASFAVRQGDTGRPLSVLFKNLDGSDVVVPGGSTCTFTMRHRQTGRAVTGAAVLADGPVTAGANNKATFNFGLTGTAQAGLYDAVWSVSYPGGETETFPTDSREARGYTVEVVPAFPDV